MLVPVIFIVALCATLAGAALENGLLRAKMTLHTAVARYSDVAISSGVADYTASLAAYVKAHGSSGPWPPTIQHSFPAALCDGAPAGSACPFAYVIDGTITNASSVANGSAGVDPALNLQRSVIAEERISVVLTATVTSLSGVALATRTRHLTYRVFEAPPYAIVSGSLDTAAVNASITTGQGDSGGAPPQPDLVRSDSDALADTRIHVQLTCSTAIPDIGPQTNYQAVIGNDGLPWGNAPNAAWEARCHQPASSVDSFADESWTSRDDRSANWTP